MTSHELPDPQRGDVGCHTEPVRKCRFRYPRTLPVGFLNNGFSPEPVTGGFLRVP